MTEVELTERLALLETNMAKLTRNILGALQVLHLAHQQTAAKFADVERVFRSLCPDLVVEPEPPKALPDDFSAFMDGLMDNERPD